MDVVNQTPVPPLQDDDILLQSQPVDPPLDKEEEINSSRNSSSNSNQLSVKKIPTLSDDTPVDTSSAMEKDQDLSVTRMLNNTSLMVLTGDDLEALGAMINSVECVRPMSTHSMKLHPSIFMRLPFDNKVLLHINTTIKPYN